jgi:hypothetical protein
MVSHVVNVKVQLKLTSIFQFKKFFQFLFSVPTINTQSTYELSKNENEKKK